MSESARSPEVGPGWVGGVLRRAGGLPIGFARLASRTAGSSVRNARRASQAATAAAAERLALTGMLLEGGAPPPVPPATAGSLIRLDRRECYRLLATSRVGRLAYVTRADQPDIVPVNYSLDGTDVLISSGRGPKLLAAERGAVVAFEVDEVDEARRTAWSVVLVGRASATFAPQRSDGGAADGRPEPWASGPRGHLIRLQPRRVEGRRLVGRDG
jgi:hypothetical protein